jgi:L-fuculose-phosphate aldolase
MNFLNTERIASIVRRAVLECQSATHPEMDSAEDPVQLFNSPAVHAIKEEIVRAGRKLWERQYVDGNGGNISVRVSPRYVVCTPTLCSKGDLRVEDLSLVDLENCQVCGSRPQTSEILLHLEIYKSVPQARAVIHCHPPYATAHAVAGVVPQGNLVPEQEVFVGPVALTPYETPGTIEFARTILPVAKNHNTILLANHGIVCWADTVTHAEWYAEVIETYCKTLMIASQLRSPLPEIPPDKILDLLAIKRKLGLPDARLPEQPEPVADMPLAAGSGAGSGWMPATLGELEIDQLVASLTARIVESFETVNEKRR